MNAPIPTSSLVSADGAVLTLREVRLHADAAAGFAAVRLTQVFVNPFDRPLEVTYHLPLPAGGVVSGFSLTVAGEVVRGVVRPREVARAAYEAALLQGRSAALLDEERADRFTQRVGNVPPGATVQIEVRLDQALDWEAGGWCWRFPTVTPPLYVDDGVGDAGALAVEVADGPLAGRLSLSLSVGDVRTGVVWSPSHGVDGEEVALTGGRARLDRDIVVRWQVAAATPGVVARCGEADGERFALLTIVPPAVPSRSVARELVLLLDVSGSMGGAPLAQLQAVCRALVDGLGDKDSLEILTFGDAPARWRRGATAMDGTGRRAALAFLDGLRASGGTAMDDGIAEALRSVGAGSQKQILLVTDGYIGFEARIVGMVRSGLADSCRLHVLGVGSSVHRALTTPVARAGRGIEAIVAPGEVVGEVVATLTAAMDRPIVVDLGVEGAEAVAPPDLLAGRPARIWVRGWPTRVTGRTAEGPWSAAVEGVVEADGAGLARGWARERVAEAEVRAACGEDVKAEIEALGVRWQISTRHTSFVAVSEGVTVDPGTPTRAVVEPQELPHGVSAVGLGLRPAMVAASPSFAPGGAPPPAPMRAEAPKRARTGGMAEAARSSAAPEDEEIDAMFAAPPPRKKEGGLLRRVIDALRGVRATLRRIDGRLVLSVDGWRRATWDPATVELELADGRRVAVRAEPGSTRAGPVSAGEVLRLVVADPGGEVTALWIDGARVALS